MDNLQEVIEQARVEFVKKFGREPRDDDPLIFDPRCETPTPMDPEEVGQMMISAMADAGIDTRLIYLYEKTGLILTEDNMEMAGAEAVEEWNAVSSEWDRLPRQAKRSYRRGLTKH